MAFHQHYIYYISNISVVMWNAKTHVLPLPGVNGVHVIQDIATKIIAFKKEVVDRQEELDIKSHQFQVIKKCVTQLESLTQRNV